MKNGSHQNESDSSLTRRRLLQASAGVAAALVGSPFAGWSQASKPEAAGARNNASGLTPASLPQKWSVGEIQRRWTAVRAEMKRANLDCLLVTQHHPGEMITERQDGDADVEYLTGISLPFKWTIFPVDGKVTALSSNQIRGAKEEKLAEERGIEVIVNDGNWSKAIIASLREKNLGQARIGVTNLLDSSRQAEGEVSYTTYDRVLKAFPQATFVPEGNFLDRVEILHSSEEIAVFEKSVAVGEVGLRAMFASARPGIPQRVVWLAMFDAMVNASGERPWRLSIRGGGSGNSALNRPLEEMLGAGQVMSQECTGTVLGYGTQVNHSFVIGSPAPGDWADAAKDSLDTFHDMVSLIAPGKKVKEICEPYDRRLVARGEKAGALVIHSGGLGTMPRGGSAGDVGEIVLQAGMVFDVKPSFRLKDGGTAQFGDSIVVTDRGARRLGTREMKVVTLS
ncbi:MAG TPA: M24 family metallopeptidase [Candidatus Acidoferrales bacterium]